MAKLTKADAARQMGISRTTLYKLIDTGKLSVHPDGSIDSAELVRAVSTVSGTAVHRGRAGGVHGVQVDVQHLDIEYQGSEHDGHYKSVQREQPVHVFSERQLTSTQALVDTLREQLQVALEREKVYQARITWLEHHVDQIQQRFDRLLEAPMAVPAPSAAAVLRPVASLPATWQQILTYMQAAPGPQTPAMVQTALGLPQTPRHIMNRMVHTGGLLRRVAPGVYSLPAPALSPA